MGPRSWARAGEGIANDVGGPLHVPTPHTFLTLNTQVLPDVLPGGPMVLPDPPDVLPEPRRTWTAGGRARHDGGMTIHRHLRCDVVEVPQGLRLLGADGRSFLLRGIGSARLAEGPLPDELVDSLQSLGLIGRERPRTVAVVGSGRLAAEVSDAVRSLDGAVVVELSDSFDLERPGGHWSALEQHSTTRLSPDLVVVCPGEPLGLRPVVELCRDRGLPALVTWCGQAAGWVGPVMSGSRPGCQNCLDMTLAHRDPMWIVTAAALRTTAPGWAPRTWAAERVARVVAEGCDEDAWALPTWSSWTAGAGGTAILAPHPDCWWCRPQDEPSEVSSLFGPSPWSTVNNSAA